jgi:hypothetical protein
MPRLQSGGLHSNGRFIYKIQKSKKGGLCRTVWYSALGLLAVI